MSYSDSIESLKAALDSFSDDEKKLSELYKNAVQNAENEYKAMTEQLNEQYRIDRNDAYSDTAREERNMFNMLAQRGLGFSGEAAQTKLNSDIILANRLGDITREKNINALKLGQDFADKKHSLALDNAEKHQDLFEKQNNLRTQIAKLELEKEQREAELRAEMERFNRQLAAEKEKQDRENAAKYFGSFFGGNSTENKTGYIPEISEKELAKILIASASNGEGYNNNEKQFYLVSRYLIDLKDNYNLNSDYYKNLLLILKSYGYTQLSDISTRAKVVSFEADGYYDGQYDKYYDKYIVNGKAEKDARESAKASALRATLDFISKKSRTEDEFRRFCRESGIDDGQINDFLKTGVKFKQSASNVESGSDIFFAGLN